MSRPAVFLDRDGVLNAADVRDGRPHPPDTVDQLSVLPGVPEALRTLQAAGFALVVITNQPDIARGTTSAEAVDAINDELLAQLGLDLDALVVCPHDDADACVCRKPKPGMIEQAAKRLDLDLAASVTIGDRWRDVEAGRAAGTRTVFIDRDYAEPTPTTQDLTVRDLPEAISWTISPQ